MVSGVSTCIHIQLSLPPYFLSDEEPSQPTNQRYMMSEQDTEPPFVCCEVSGPASVNRSSLSSLSRTRKKNTGSSSSKDHVSAKATLAPQELLRVMKPLFFRYADAKKWHDLSAPYPRDPDSSILE